MLKPCPELSLREQCELVGISRSEFYCKPVPESEENLALLRRLDELHLALEGSPGAGVRMRAT